MTTNHIPQHAERAWDLIGHEGQFRISVASTPSGKPGRTIYEAVQRNEATARSTDRVRLSRLVVGPEGVYQIDRWVDANTWIWVIRDDTAEYEAQKAAEYAALTEKD